MSEKKRVQVITNADVRVYSQDMGIPSGAASILSKWEQVAYA